MIMGNRTQWNYFRGIDTLARKNYLPFFPIGYTLKEKICSGETNIFFSTGPRFISIGFGVQNSKQEISEVVSL